MPLGLAAIDSIEKELPMPTKTRTETSRTTERKQATRGRQAATQLLEGSRAPSSYTFKEHELPPLPYALDALEPHMSAATLEYHHGKHHKAYVDTLNELIAGTQWAEMGLEEIVRKSDGVIFNNAAQAWNHTFFWDCLSPAGGGKPIGGLARAIDATYGSLDAFKKKFTSAAIAVFGSGWAWLVRDPSGAISIETTANAYTPITGDNRPLLTCDVWEHAYYLDHKNARPDFLKAYWKIANWEFAGRNFDM
jgi:Fe-Mn family superoxide dismutase